MSVQSATGSPAWTQQSTAEHVQSNSQSVMRAEHVGRLPAQLPQLSQLVWEALPLSHELLPPELPVVTPVVADAVGKPVLVVADEVGNPEPPPVPVALGKPDAPPAPPVPLALEVDPVAEGNPPTLVDGVPPAPLLDEPVAPEVGVPRMPGMLPPSAQAIGRAMTKPRLPQITALRSKGRTELRMLA
jgi:hypothetical protein